MVFVCQAVHQLMNCSIDTSALNTSGPGGLSCRFFSRAQHRYVPIYLRMNFPENLSLCSLKKYRVNLPCNVSILFSSFISNCQFSTCSTLDPNYSVNKLLFLGCYHILRKHYIVLFLPSISVVHQSKKSMLSWTSFCQVSSTFIQLVLLEIPLLP